MRVSSDRRSPGSVLTQIQFEVEVTDSTSAAGGDEHAASSSVAAASRAKTDATSEALKVEIQTLLEQLPNLDHYNALGLGASASPADIKRAYFRAAKKFHPDALARLGLGDLHDAAARVFGRIAEAFETLSDPNKKAAYDAGGSDEPEIDTARLAQAETSFRKGEILVRMGNFASALEYLEPAVELWPEEPAYQAALGWALYRQPRSDAARAREHLETASSQAPNDAVLLFRLGVVLRALGEAEAAKAMLERARVLDPSMEE
jgi:tetratricopeptide (TPR) repeat protein